MTIIFCRLLIIAAIVLAAPQIDLASDLSRAGKASSKAASVQPSKKKLYGHIDEAAYALGAAGVTLDADKLPALVGNVRMGSPAFYAGLAENDKVVTGRISNNTLYLTIERSGKKYSLSLHTTATDLIAGTGAANARLNTPMLKIQEKAEDHKPKPEELLAAYDIVIVVDTSGSMGESLPSVQEVKWLWCANFIHDFAERMRPYSKNAITLVTFNDSFVIEHGCGPERVEQLFKTRTPGGNTNMSTPLRHVLFDYLSGSRSRPLLIAVLTDGMPNLGEPVERVIKEATQQLHSAREVRMTFLEIGEEYNGQALIKLLDDYLVQDGAKYDIVDSLTFEELRSMGLTEALLRALNDKSVLTGKSSTLDQELAKLKQQIADERNAFSPRKVHGHP